MNEVRGGGAAVTIRYCLSFRRVFWVALAMAGFILFAFGTEGLPIATALVAILFAWFWIFFMNVVIRVWQFDRLIEEIVDSVRRYKR